MNLKPEYDITPAVKYVWRDDHSRCSVCDNYIRLDELIEGPDGSRYCIEHWDEKKKDYLVKENEEEE